MKEVTQRLKVAICELAICGDGIRIKYDLFTAGEDPEKITETPATKTITYDSIMEMKRGVALKKMKADKSNVKAVYEDVDHLIDSEDAFFVNKRDFTDAAMEIINNFLKL